MFRFWLSRMKQRVARSNRRGAPSRRKPPSARPELLQLEDRTLLTVPGPVSQTFTVTNQNQFDTASTTSDVANTAFLGGTFNTGNVSFGGIDHEVISTDLGDIDLGYYGAQVSMAMSGKAGLGVDFTANSDAGHNFGTVSSSVTASLTQNYQEPSSFGEVVTFDPSNTFATLTGGNFSTVSPSFGYGAHLLTDLNASLSGQFAVVKISGGSTSFGGSIDVPLFSMNEHNSGEVDFLGLPILGASTSVDGVKTLDGTLGDAASALENFLLSKALEFNISQTPPLSLRVDFSTPSAFDFKQSLDLRAGVLPDKLGVVVKAANKLGVAPTAVLNLGSVEEKAPSIDLSTGGPAGGVLTASGESEIAQLSVQTGPLAAALFPLLAPPPVLTSTVSLAVGPASVSLTPVSFQLQPTLYASQTATIKPVSHLTYQFRDPRTTNPTNVAVTLNGTQLGGADGVSSVTFTPGVDTLGIRFAGTPILVQPSWEVDDVLTNQIDLNAAMDSDLTVGQVGASVPGLGNYNFGPLYHQTFRLADTTLENLITKQITIPTQTIPLPAFTIGDGFKTSTVVTTQDDNNMPGPEVNGVLTDNSLRDAIIAANLNDLNAPVVIRLGAGTYKLTLPPNQFHDGFNGGLRVTAPDVTILGAGPGQTIIDATGLGDRVFFVGGGSHFTLQGVTVQGGDATAGVNADVSDGNGGAVYGDEGSMVVINDCAITGNQALVSGGGIYEAIGSLTIQDSTISDNTAPGGGGGGIVAVGPLTILDSTVSGNSAGDGPGGVSSNYGPVTVTRSTFSGNTGSLGAGLSLFTPGPGSRIDSSTFSGNTNVHQPASTTGNADGGGLWVEEGSLTVVNSTFANNVVQDPNGVGGGIDVIDAVVSLLNDTIVGNTSDYAGGLYVHPSAFTSVTLHNTILSDNNANKAMLDGEGPVLSGGHNIIGDPVGITGLGPDDYPNTHPNLDPLGDYGGPTATMRLRPGSPGIDQGSSPAPSADQRGFPRPVGQAPDVGAVEYQYDLSVAGTAGIAGGTVTYSFTVTNAGPDPATGLKVTDVLPAGVSYQQTTARALSWFQSTPAQGTNGTVTYTIQLGRLFQPGDSASFSFTASLGALPGAPLVNPVAVSPATEDTYPANNTAKLTVYAEGQAFQDAELLHLVNPFPELTSDNYSATVNWGDGNPTAAPGSAHVVVNPDGTLDVLGSYTYAEEGNQAPSISLKASAPGRLFPPFVAQAGKVAVADAPLAGQPLTLPPVVLGRQLQDSVLYHFTDTGAGVTAGNFAAAAFWGDGTHNFSDDGSGKVAVVANPAGGFDVIGSHDYAAGVQGAIYSVKLTDVNGVPFYSPALFHFTDADPGAALTDYTAKITWGDNQSDTSGGGSELAFVVPDPAGGFDVLGSHAYTTAIRDGTFTVRVTDAGGAGVAVSAPFSVDYPLTAGTLTPPAVTTEGQAVQNAVLFHFGDGDPQGQASDFSATVAWGDGTGSATGDGTLSVVANAQGGFDVVGSHTFGEVPAGTLFAVHVVDVDGATTGASSTALSVADPAVVAAGGFQLTPTEGAASGLQTVATFTDPGGAEALGDYAASVTWGDGSPATAGTITYDATSGVFTVQAGHTYTAAGSYPINVTIHHDQAPDASASSSASVLDPAVTASGGAALSTAEGQDSGNQVLATFTDPGGAGALSDYQPTIDWGDGTGGAGTVQFNHNAPLGQLGHLLTGRGPAATAVADLNGDGKADLVVANQQDGTVQVFLGNGDGTFQAPATYSLGAAPNALAVADLNGDGKPDLVTANSSSSTVSVLLNQGDGSFGPAQALSTGSNGLNPAAVAVADLNRDGKADLITANAGSNTISVLLGTGGGGFGAVQTFAVNGLQPVALAVGDVGGDQVPDVVVADAGSDQVSILLGLGNGTFLDPETVAVGKVPSAVALVDLNGDRRPDLITANSGSNDVSVLLNPTNRQFKAEQSFATGTVPVSLRVADVNGDGKPDLVTADNRSQDPTADPGGDVAVLLGKGDGTFQAASYHPLGATPGTLAVGDLTGTGVPDLVTADALDNSVSLLLPSYQVVGHHTYADESGANPYTITVHLGHGSAPATVVTSGATVSDPAVVAAPAAVTAVEGTGANLVVATFTDPGGPEAVSAYSASIAWGDGTTTPQGSAPIFFDSGTGTFQVVGSHTYAEEGSYPVSVTIYHDNTTPQTVTGTATVSDPAVAATGGQTVTSAEGADTGLVPLATFTDPGGPESLSDYSADVSWGDGTGTAVGAGVLSFNSATGVFTVSGEHLYAEEGSYTITVTVHHDNTAAQTVTSTAAVSDPAVVATAGQTFQSVEGASTGALVLATFTDPGGSEPLGDYAALISWGDGSTGAGFVGQFNGTPNVQGGHVYAEEGAYTVSVTIFHDSAQPVTVTDTVTVSDPAVVATGGFTVRAAEGADSGLQTVATFTDPGGAEDVSNYAASIAWGDGQTSAGTITVSNGTFTVQGGHAYAEEGGYQISVTLTHESTPAVTVTGGATVSDPAVVATGGLKVAAVEGVASGTQAVATFTDPGGPEALADYSATIDWGDGTSSVGTITRNGNTFTVSGGHTYAEEGGYTVTTTVKHDAAPAATAVSQAAVADAVPVVGPLGGQPKVLPGQADAFSATFTDTGVLDTHTAVFDWGDAPAGQHDTAAATVAEANGSGSVSGSHVYAAPGTYTVTLTVADDEGTASTPVTYTVNVTESGLILNPSAAGALTASGNATVNLSGGLVVDSGSPSAITASGNASITASRIDVVGGTSVSGHATLNPSPNTKAAPAADPFAGLAAPSVGGTPASVDLSGKASLTIQPGVYSQIKVSGNASLTLLPGVYVIAGGGIAVTGNASVSGTGVFFYNAGSNYPSAGGNFGGITLAGNGSITLSAPAAGQPYAGLLIFQARDNTRALSLSGNGALGTTGTIYAPAAGLVVSGNARLHDALVVNTLTLTGNGSSSLTDGSDGVSNDAGTLLAGDLTVYVDNSGGLFTADELARVQDAVAGMDAVLAPYNVVVTVVGDADRASANVVLDTAATSACGGAADGALGCHTDTGEVTLVQGWDWYAGADPAGIGAGQYDFQTAVTHELGHALGLGHSADPASVMHGTLDAGVAHRALQAADLNIPDGDNGPDGLHAALPLVPPQPEGAPVFEAPTARIHGHRGHGHLPHGHTGATLPIVVPPSQPGTVPTAARRHHGRHSPAAILAPTPSGKAGAVEGVSRRRGLASEAVDAALAGGLEWLDSLFLRRPR